MDRNTTDGKKKIDTDSVISIPSSIFKDRALSVLEVLTEFLKEQEGLTYHEIAVLLGRDDRTIWTCFSRAKKKRENANK